MIGITLERDEGLLSRGLLSSSTLNDQKESLAREGEEHNSANFKSMVERVVVWIRMFHYIATI